MKKLAKVLESFIYRLHNFKNSRLKFFILLQGAKNILNVLLTEILNNLFIAKIFIILIGMIKRKHYKNKLKTRK